MRDVIVNRNQIRSFVKSCLSLNHEHELIIHGKIIRNSSLQSAQTQHRSVVKSPITKLPINHLFDLIFGFHEIL